MKFIVAFLICLIIFHQCECLQRKVFKKILEENEQYIVKESKENFEEIMNFLQKKWVKNEKEVDNLLLFVRQAFHGHKNLLEGMWETMNNFKDEIRRELKKQRENRC
jgi:uncharacterized membrane protein